MKWLFSLLKILQAAEQSLFGKVFPPLLFLPLVAIPPDLISGIFWGTAFIAVIISVVHLSLWGYKGFVSSEKSVSKKKFIRPALTIFIVTAALISVEVSKIPAKKYVIEEAEKILSLCNKNGECPEENEIFPSGIPGKGYIAKYRITYMADKKNFQIFVRYNIDNGFSVLGGVNKDLKFSHKNWKSGHSP